MANILRPLQLSTEKGTRQSVHMLYAACSWVKAVNLPSCCCDWVARYCCCCCNSCICCGVGCCCCWFRNNCCNRESNIMNTFCLKTHIILLQKLAFYFLNSLTDNRTTNNKACQYIQPSAISIQFTLSQPI